MRPPKLPRYGGHAADGNVYEWILRQAQEVRAERTMRDTVQRAQIRALAVRELRATLPKSPQAELQRQRPAAERVEPSAAG